jgi:hypothetical protein
VTDDRQKLMSDYLQALVRRDDISRYFTSDVVWRTMETGEEVVGAQLSPTTSASFTRCCLTRNHA